MVKILKASAGSGKTYNLAREYIRLVIGSQQADAYRHVLAVTFTNKATDEMKRRILKELNTLAREPQKSPYLEDLKSELKLSESAIQKKAQQQLSGILHDYSAFAVSTIDKFFQQTLRAFSREIGQFTAYQVQLDRKALVEESVDRMLDALEEGELLDWISRSVREDLRENGSYSIDKSLREMAESLKDLPASQDFHRESLTKLKKICREVVDAFPERVEAAAQAILDALAPTGVTPEDTNGHFLKAIRNYIPADAKLKPPTDAFLNKATHPELWFAKAKAGKMQELGGALDEPLQAFLQLFDLPYKEYKTAKAILDQIYSLGVAAELRASFVAIQKERNLLCLDDSNTILQGIIDGTDAPFIYEKLGVRYESFLLDEFQDTAGVQWENFRPLLVNSEASGNDSLVVGDVKQSIYRWRGSDWDLLEHRLQEDFHQARIRVLDGNYRTCREIVSFNNELFPFLARRLDALVGSDKISHLYRDVCQEVCFRDQAPGSVEVCFTENQLEEILQTLTSLREHGAQWQDVAILVRNNKEGCAIAAELLKNHIPVVSDESLQVKSSITVRRLVSQLSLVEAPPSEDAPSVAGFLARSMQVHIPSAYHSLSDLSEALLRDIREADEAVFDAEVPYIQSFMDYLQDWVSNNGNNLDAFLKAWAEANPSIASPQRGNSVRILTVHKAKGLEFPFVVVPFAEKVEFYKGDARWCQPRLQGTSLENKAEGTYRVTLDGGMADSFFEEDYRRERFLQAVDNINIFYVALTRAKYGMKIICAPLPKTYKGPGNMAHLLHEFTGGDHYFRGEAYDWSTLRRENDDTQVIEARYASFPADSGKRLRFSPEALDYFGTDGSFGPEASRRIRGSVLHAILEKVHTPEDLPSAVEAAVGAGELPATMKAETLRLLAERIDSVKDREWFSPASRILSEATILAPDGGEYRPDRVVVHPDGSVDVIDYKFGEPKPAYIRQVQRYENLYRRMGYAKVAGYLWYLEDNLITFVS